MNTASRTAVAPDSLLGRVRDWLLLERAETTARSYDPPTAARVRALHAAGDRRMRAARRLDAASMRVAECALLRDALRLYLRASESAPAHERRSPALAPAVVNALDGTDDALDALDEDSLLALRAELLSAVDAHRRDVEVRSVLNIRATRVGRLVGITLLVVWLVAASMVHALRPPNLARGMPVSASSHYPGTPTTGEGLVDGDTGGDFAIHTNREQNAWVMIDLQRTAWVHVIKVYNRGDGWFDEGLPLVVELSEDGTKWQEIGRRTTHFDQDPPWELDAEGRPARFVRLRVDGRGIVALSEVEVFGKP